MGCIALDDVQQVSDTVATLDHRVMVAQCPIEQLLAGSAIWHTTI